MLPLRELQLRFLGALDPASPPIDAALLAAVNGTGSLDAAQRIGIYADMYRARLVDVLREDYPRVAAILGDADVRGARVPLPHPPSVDASVGAPRGTPLRRLDRRRGDASRRTWPTWRGSSGRASRSSTRRTPSRCAWPTSSPCPPANGRRCACG